MDKTLMEFETMMQTEIQKLCSIETQTVDALGRMASMAQNDGLKQALTMHQQETQEQVTRIQQICTQMGWNPAGETSQTLGTMQQEAEQMLANLHPGPVMDAMIIASVQKVEHLEMACYGTARALAMQMGHQEAARLLQQTLDEEKRTDEMLTQIATSGVNQQAAATAASLH